MGSPTLSRHNDSTTTIHNNNNNIMSKDVRIWGATITNLMEIWGAFLCDSRQMSDNDCHDSTLTQQMNEHDDLTVTTHCNDHERSALTPVVSMCRGVTDGRNRYAISRLDQSRTQCDMDIPVDRIDRKTMWYVPKYDSLVLNMVGYLGICLETAYGCTYSYVNYLLLYPWILVQRYTSTSRGKHRVRYSL